MRLGDPLLLAIWLPIAAGLFVAFLPRAAHVFTKIVALGAAGVSAFSAAAVWVRAGSGPVKFAFPAWELTGRWRGRALLHVDALSGFVGAAVGILAFLMTLYAIGHTRDKDAPSGRLYSGILLSIGAALGSVWAENLVVLAVFWGLMGVPFYLLLNLGKEGAPAAAKKSLIMVGGADGLLVLGIALIWVMTGGRLDIHSFQPRIMTLTTAGAIAYVCFMAAAFAKAGAIPLHSWIPDAAATAPIPAVALLPASLDKLLGIYLLARASLTIFEMSGYLRALVMVLGAITVLAAVFMALIQHDLRKLLGFHAVSQVGYMVLGIGTGTIVGIAGGVFHMLNNAIYKACLFLTAGSAERKAGTSELGKLGGLAKVLPVTFVSAVIAALAISGVPPLNGFVSKWMVYQGLVEVGKRGGYLWIVLLAAAVFGSALTLASFVKVIYSVFLAPPASERTGEKPAEGPGENFATALPMALLALACVVFGVAAFSLPLKAVFSAIGAEGEISGMLPGLWRPGIATVLLLVGIAIGFLFYLLGTAARPREDAPYVGGEVAPDHAFTGLDFYETMTRISPLAGMYKRAAAGLYDLYQWGCKLAAYAGRGLGALHGGLLHSYVTWLLFGVVVLLWAFLKLR